MIAPPGAVPHSPKVLLIGWDAADWKIIKPLMEAGEMPVLARFVEQGVMGDMTTLEPVLSPMLWNSIATGKRADKHGILGFTEPNPNGGGVRPVTSTSRRAKALWNILSQEGYRSNVVNWFAGHPAERINGVVVSDAFARPFPQPGEPWPVLPHSVHPEQLAGELSRFRVRPEQVTPETVRLFAPRAAEVNQEKDRQLWTLRKLIAEALSVHAISAHLLEHYPCDFMAAYYGAIDHFSHGFMRFHPPRRRGIHQQSFEIYRDVINSAYRMHDLMLGALLALVDDETTVILLSDHGFHSDHLRPRSIPRVPTGPAIEHRPIGILAMRGPGLKQDELIYGANLLDIAPTVLSICGLSVGRDMDGRVLAEAFEQAPKNDTIESWENIAPPGGEPRVEFEISSTEAESLLQQFVELGYVEDPAKGKEVAEEQCRAEQNWNLACVLLDADRYEEALPLLESVHEQLPERPDVAIALARTLMRLDLLAEAEAMIFALFEDGRETPFGRWLLGELAFRRKNYGESFEHLAVAQQAHRRLPHLHVQIGQTLLKLKACAEAEQSFRQAISIDKQNAKAHLGLAAALLAQRRNLPAAEAALAAVSYAHPLPLGHYYLGVALNRMGQVHRAALALETATRLRPSLVRAHLALARVHRRLGNAGKALEHENAALQAKAERQRARAKRTAFRQAAAARVRDRIKSSKPMTRSTVRNSNRGSKGRSVREPLSFLIVSGLPRSGTSLMMQMLSCAGVPVMTDQKRAADTDNPEGYFEWEAIKKLPQQPEILRQAGGKTIKVISALLPALPRQHRYRVIFMDRALDEVVASQARMIKNRNGSERSATSGNMVEMLARHRGQVLQKLARSPNVQSLIVDYGQLVAAPEAVIPRLTEFIGEANIPHPEAMAGAVRPQLHRNRGFSYVR